MGTLGGRTLQRVRVAAAAAFVTLGGLGSAGVSAEVSVSAGVAGYTYPIKVPPGIGGMAPQLALSYSSGGGQGIAGFGWSLSGLSAVTRCPTTYAIDGVRRGIRLTTADRFCWDGKRLIQTDVNGTPTDQSTYGQDATEYRTETDGIARIRAYGAAGGNAANGPQYFKVWTKAGQILTFGNTIDSRTIGQGGTQVGAWLINRVADTVGNYMDFYYDNNTVSFGSGTTSGPVPGTETTLREIRYTGNGSQTPSNSVYFEYGDGTNYSGVRPDSSESYTMTTKMVNTKLLMRISTFVGGPGTTAVKRYQLLYAQSPNSKRSRLTGVSECNAAYTACLPATQFTYSDGPSPAGFTAAPGLNFGVGQLKTNDGNYGVLLGDFNGDGRTDVLRYSNFDPTQNRVLVSNVDARNGSYAFTPQVVLQNETLFSFCNSSFVADMNGDGITDLVNLSAPVSQYDSSGKPLQCGAYTGKLYLASGGQFQAPITLNVPLLRKPYRVTVTGGATPIYHGTGDNFYFGDYNGDGLPDILTTHVVADSESGQPIVSNSLYRNNNDGTFTAVPTNISDANLFSDPRDQMDVMRDLNRDGLADFCNKGQMYISDGNGNFTATGPGTCGDWNQLALDANGDRNADFIFATDNSLNSTLLIGRGDGTVFTQDPAVANIDRALIDLNATPSFGIQIADVNGDGNSDLVYWNNSAQNALFISNGRGGFSVQPAFTGVQLKAGDGSADFLIGDFSGLGAAEFLLMSSTGAAQILARPAAASGNSYGPQADLLTVVTLPTGGVTELAYGSLAEPTGVYSLDRSAGPGYPDTLVQPPMPVVERISKDVGAGSARVTGEFRYANLRANLQGRGVTGFQRVLSTAQGAETANSSSNYITAVTDYRQDHPFIGMPTRLQSFAGTKFNTMTGKIKDITTVYCDRIVKADTSCPETATIAAALVPRKPYAYQSQEQAWDLNGVALPTSTTTNAMDDWLNATQITASITGDYAGTGSRTYSKVTTNTYLAANTTADNWLLGRLTRATVASTTPDDPVADMLATGPGTAAYASNTQGTAPSALSVTLPSGTLSATSAPGTVSASTTATASGGFSPYTFSWTRLTGSVIAIGSPSSASSSFSTTLSSPGQSVSEQFKVTATDSAGSTATATLTVTLSTPAAPPVVASVSPSAVTGSLNNPGTGTASATASASGGTPPFTYSWSRLTGSRISVSGGQNATFSASLGWSENFTESFRMTATDSLGTVGTKDVAVTFTTPAAMSVWADTSDVNTPSWIQSSCAHPSGGTGGYTYSWSKLSGPSTINITSGATSQCASIAGSSTTALCWASATFQVTVTDSGGNQTSATSVMGVWGRNPNSDLCQ